MRKRGPALRGHHGIGQCLGHSVTELHVESVQLCTSSRPTRCGFIRFRNDPHTLIAHQLIVDPLDLPVSLHGVDLSFYKILPGHKIRKAEGPAISCTWIARPPRPEAPEVPSPAWRRDLPMEPPWGVEPQTCSLRVSRSAD